jgi:hypothetical protein
VSRRPPSARDIPEVERAPTRSPIVIGLACALPRTVSRTGSSAVSADQVGTGDPGGVGVPVAPRVRVTVRRTGSKAGSNTSVTAVTTITTTVAAVGDHRWRYACTTVTSPTTATLRATDVRASNIRSGSLVNRMIAAPGTTNTKMPRIQLVSGGAGATSETAAARVRPARLSAVTSDQPETTGARWSSTGTLGAGPIM